MIKKEGFSLIELLIVIGVSMILALIGLPNIMKWYQKDDFINQANKILDTLSDARASALSDKKCPNGATSKAWEWSINKSSKVLELNCLYNSGNQENKKNTIFNNNISFGNHFLDDNSTPDSSNSLKIIFNSGSADVNIFAGIHTDLKDLKLTLNFPEENSYFRTLCFNRFARFPTLSSTTSCDD